MSTQNTTQSTDTKPVKPSDASAQPGVSDTATPATGTGRKPRPKVPRGTVKRLWGYISQYPVRLVIVVLSIIVSAAALAFIVLYNLTNINVEERVREIASLKVLGFTRREVYAYVFREIILLAVIGDVLGLVLGIFLERFVVVTAEVDYVMFGRTIHPESFAYAFALTLAFAVLVILFMRRKLDRVDMVESLKSID